MEPLHLLLLLSAGLAAGFVAGLLGVGGGIIFAPVLFFHFQALGIAEQVIAPLTIGSSLLCTCVASIASAWTQYRRDAVILRVALLVGIFSALAVFLMTRFVTTAPWYDGTVFQIVFSLVLLSVVSRMLLRKRPRDLETKKEGLSGSEHPWTGLAAAGSAAGAVAAAAGVGGGIVLVPAYSYFMHIPIRTAVGTSSATVVLISLVGIINYAWIGSGEPVPSTALGYVDLVRSVTLAVPAVFTAHLGVRLAHRINQTVLRLSFAAIAAVVAVRLIVGALT